MSNCLSFFRMQLLILPLILVSISCQPANTQAVATTASQSVKKPNQIVLVKSGKSQAAVILPDKTIPTQNFAAQEFIYHVKKSTGAELPLYSAADRQWWYFCPVWHTGQAVKALVMAADFFDDEKYLIAARLGADFIFANQIWDKSHLDHSLILAFEDIPDKVNTSAVMECMHGLMLLADKLDSRKMWERIIAAGHLLIDRMYMPHEGLFRDMYDHVKREVFLPNPFRTKNDIGGRPLLEDAILVKLYEKTGDRKFLNVHVKISERLLIDEYPAGNWIDYSPCDRKMGKFHPRHTYWWGMPLIDTYRVTGRKEFLETAIASGRFCENAMRADGGWLRGYYTDGKTDSFGHATSGSACASILWMEIFKETHDRHWLTLAEKALEYCDKMQFINPQDGNLKGAILEKILPPDGTDRSPYYIRDLGTIFYVIASITYISANSDVLEFSNLGIASKLGIAIDGTKVNKT